MRVLMILSLASLSLAGCAGMYCNENRALAQAAPQPAATTTPTGAPVEKRPTPGVEPGNASQPSEESAPPARPGPEPGNASQPSR